MDKTPAEGIAKGAGRVRHWQLVLFSLLDRNLPVWQGTYQSPALLQGSMLCISTDCSRGGAWPEKVTLDWPEAWGWPSTRPGSLPGISTSW
jgi:hypothetical protein